MIDYLSPSLCLSFLVLSLCVSIFCPVFSPELRQCLLGVKSLPDMSREEDLLCAAFGSDRQPAAHSREHCIKVCWSAACVNYTFRFRITPLQTSLEFIFKTFPQFMFAPLPLFVVFSRSKILSLCFLAASLSHWWVQLVNNASVCC